MADDIAGVTDEIEKLVQQLEQLGIINLNASKKMGVLEKQQLKIKTAFEKNPIRGMVVSLAGMAKAVGNVTKFVANSAAMSQDEREERYKNLTALQKLTIGMVFFGGVAKANNKILNTANNRFTRLVTRIFSLVSIFLIVGFALAALSIAFDGSNSVVLTLTENMGPLHDAMQGLSLAIAGEGDDGLAALFDILAVSVLASAVAFAIFNAPLALTVGAIFLMIGIYQLVKNETDNVASATLAAAGVFTGFFALMVGFFGWGSTASLLLLDAISRTLFAFLGGLALIMVGVAGMIAYLTGAGDGFKAILLGVGSAIAIGLGLFLVGVAAVPAAIIAAIIFVVVSVIRYWDEIMSILTTAKDWLFGLAGLIFYGALAGLALLIAGVASLLALIVGVVLGIVNGLWTALVNVVSGFWTALFGGGEALKEWFFSIPSTIKDGLVSGFKNAFNAVIDIYNDFAKGFDFKIPDYVPVIGGKNFSLGDIPKLAKGGIVNSPTLAMIGEDGPEAVVPLSKRNNPNGIGLGGGGGGTTININVGGVTDRTDKKQLAREIGDLIRAEMSRSGRSYGNRRSAV
jgi:hypothetical protein